MSIFDIFKRSKKDYDTELKKYEEMVNDCEHKVLLDVDKQYTTKQPVNVIGVSYRGGGGGAGGIYTNNIISNLSIDDFRIPGNRITETDEAKVSRILKGDFEKKFGMTFEKFIETYNKMLEECPEKLI